MLGELARTAASRERFSKIVRGAHCAGAECRCRRSSEAAGSSVGRARRVQCASDENAIRWWRRSWIDRSRGARESESESEGARAREREKEQAFTRRRLTLGSLSGRRTGTVFFRVYAHASEEKKGRETEKASRE